MRGQAEGLSCTYTVARNPISVSQNIDKKIRKLAFVCVCGGGAGPRHVREIVETRRRSCRTYLALGVDQVELLDDVSDPGLHHKAGVVHCAHPRHGVGADILYDLVILLVVLGEAVERSLAQVVVHADLAVAEERGSEVTPSDRKHQSVMQ